MLSAISDETFALPKNAFVKYYGIAFKMLSTLTVTIWYVFPAFELQYADLDEFLSENNIPDGLPGTHLGHSTGLGHRNDSLGHSTGLALGLGHITTKRERSPSPSDCVSPDTINPPSPAESSECDCET